MSFSILALQGRRYDILRRVWALESDLASSVSLGKLLNVSEPLFPLLSVVLVIIFFFFRVVVRIK